MRYACSMARSADLYDVMTSVCPAQAPYAVALAFRIRYAMQMNAREAMHMMELRSGRTGPSRVPRRGAGDASAHRRARRTPAHRRGDDICGPSKRTTSSASAPKSRAEARRSAAVPT